MRVSLYMILGLSTHSPRAIAHLGEIAERHSRRQLDIRPELYSLWLDSLLQAVSEFDPSYDEGVDQAWRRVLGTGIDIMRARY